MAQGPLLQSTTAPRWSPRSAPVVFEGRAILLLASSMALVAGLSVFGWRGLAFATFTLAVVTVQVSVAMLASRAVRRFDRRFQELLNAGDVTGLEPLVQRSHLVRFFAPRGWFAAKEGLVYVLKNDFETAEQKLELAWASTEIESRPALVPLMCRVKFRLGRCTDVQILAEDWLRFEPGGPGIWYSIGCELRGMPNTNDTEIAMRVHAAPDVVDGIDAEARSDVLSYGY